MKQNSFKVVLPGSVIGIIGGGQLGLMMGQSALQLGFKVIILDPEENCPASQVAQQVIVAEYNNKQALSKLAQLSDVVTYEFENVDVAGIESISQQTFIPQGTTLLKIAQHRLEEKKFLQAANVPIVPFKSITSFADLKQASLELGFPCVLKTCRGGYDGKGQWVLHSSLDLEPLQTELNFNQEFVLEQWVNYEREVSIIVAGNLSEEYCTFPVIENEHQHNILKCSMLPASISSEVAQEAECIGLKIAREARLVGTMAIEFFVKRDGQLYINEIAPRPHNSGHLTIEACSHSQFDLHIRGICQWKLPSEIRYQPAVMVNLIGAEYSRMVDVVAQKPNWYFHDYGKTKTRSGRKMGHVTFINQTEEAIFSLMRINKIWEGEAE